MWDSKAPIRGIRFRERNQEKSNNSSECVDADKIEPNMPNNKMKGLLKGLRYISQIFENEKDGEMQIGFPTDVKHVAHIGWDDGPSVNQPSWMNGYKAPSGWASSAPLNLNDGKVDAPVKWISEDSTPRRSARGPSQADESGCPTREKETGGPPYRDRDAELPKSSRRRSSVGNTTDESSATEKTDRPKQRKPLKNTGHRELPEGAKPTRHPKEPASDIPKKTRRRKPKDEGTTRSRSKAHATDCDAGGSESGSVLNSDDNKLGHSSLEEGAGKGFTGIS